MRLISKCPGSNLARGPFIWGPFGAHFFKPIWPYWPYRPDWLGFDPYSKRLPALTGCTLNVSTCWFFCRSMNEGKHVSTLAGSPHSHQICTHMHQMGPQAHQMGPHSHQMATHSDQMGPHGYQMAHRPTKWAHRTTEWA